MPENNREVAETEHAQALLEGKSRRIEKEKGTVFERRVGSLGISMYGLSNWAWDENVAYQWGQHFGKEYAYKTIDYTKPEQRKSEMVDDDWLSVCGIIQAIRLDEVFA